MCSKSSKKMKNKNDLKKRYGLSERKVKNLKMSSKSVTVCFEKKVKKTNWKMSSKRVSAKSCSKFFFTYRVHLAILTGFFFQTY